MSWDLTILGHWSLVLHGVLFRFHEMKSSLISEKFSCIIILNIYSGPLFPPSLETLVMHLLYLLYVFSPSSWILSSLSFYLVLPLCSFWSLYLLLYFMPALPGFRAVWSSFLKWFCLFLLVLSWGLSVLTYCLRIFFKNFSHSCVSAFWSPFKQELLFSQGFLFYLFSVHAAILDQNFCLSCGDIFIVTHLIREHQCSFPSSFM